VKTGKTGEREDGGGGETRGEGKGVEEGEFEVIVCGRGGCGSGEFLVGAQRGRCPGAGSAGSDL
jgi:hypothetical protein